MEPTAPAADRRLFAGFLRSCDTFADRSAIRTDSRNFSYAELRDRAFAIAAALRSDAGADGPLRTGILAHRSITAFAGLLAGLMEGSYVPLNLNYPVARTLHMIAASGCTALVVDGKSERHLDEILEAVGRSLLVVLPVRDSVSDLRPRFPRHRLLGREDLPVPDRWTPGLERAESAAYVLFTSGSTGAPKGVAVSHESARHFVSRIADRFEITPDDHLSQFADLTWDASLNDMFVGWERGAHVHCPSLRTRMFLEGTDLTVFHIVPSIVQSMRRISVLKPGMLPRARCTLFGGEALPVETAAFWQQVAPNSRVENLYGATEKSAVMFHRFDAASGQRFEKDLLPIGNPMPGLEVRVVDEHLNEVPAGVEGELLVHGPHTDLGYLDAPELNAAAYVELGDGKVFYRTHDRVRVSAEHGWFTFLGRNDRIVKKHGVRIDLGEVEFALRSVSGSDNVAVVGWPVVATSVEGIVAFVANPQAPPDGLRHAVAEQLPDFMIPDDIYVVPELPLNHNGKIDRIALVDRLRSGDALPESV